MVTAGVAAAVVVLAIVALIVPGYRDTKRLAALNVDIGRLDGEVCLLGGAGLGRDLAEVDFDGRGGMGVEESLAAGAA